MYILKAVNVNRKSYARFIVCVYIIFAILRRGSKTGDTSNCVKIIVYLLAFYVENIFTHNDRCIKRKPDEILILYQTIQLL